MVHWREIISTSAMLYNTFLCKHGVVIWKETNIKLIAHAAKRLFDLWRMDESALHWPIVNE